jgi:hypothetical protein
MKRFITVMTAGVFLVSLPGPGWSQREVTPPAVPPILEGQRPLEKPDTQEPSPPKRVEEGKVKPKAKARDTKRGKQANVKAKEKPQDVQKQAITAKKPGEKGKTKKAAKGRGGKSKPSTSAGNPG